MDGDDIRGLHQLFQRTICYAVFRFFLRRHTKGVVIPAGDLKSLEHTVKLLGDIAESHKTDHLSVHCVTLGPHLGFEPLPPANRTIHVGDTAVYTDHQAKRHQNALRDRGIEVQRDRIVFSRDPADSYALMEKLYAGKEKPDAIFIASSQMSFGVLRYVQDHRLSVPRDVALVNFDDYEWADITAPTPLTTIRQPANELGRAAAKLMLERIQNPDSAYRTIMLDSQLIERGSL